MPNIQVNFRITHHALAKIHQGLKLNNMEAPPSLAGLCRAGVNAGIRLLCHGDVTDPPADSLQYVEHLTKQVTKGVNYTDWRDTPRLSAQPSLEHQRTVDQSWSLSCLEYVPPKDKQHCETMLAHLNEGAPAERLWKAGVRHQEVLLILQVALSKVGQTLNLPDSPH